jgi:hypothetical protein
MKVLLLLALIAVRAPLRATDVSTFHNDTARSGHNTAETILTTTNVQSATFGKLYNVAVDGTVDAQPLYLASITIPNQGTHNVLYVVTENDSAYALDADTGSVLWKVSALGTGEVPSDAHSCGQISPQIGITDTPVIDRTAGPHGTIYFVAMSKDTSGNYYQRLHALDVTTGVEQFSGPVTIQAQYPGTGDGSQGGNVIFAPGQYAERAGLLELHGVIYTAWTSHCDQRPYTGWIIGYNKNTLAQTSVLNLTPNGNEGSIWQAGGGLVSDGASIYFLDANGVFDSTLNAQGFPSQGDYGNAFVRLSTTNHQLAVADYFEMDNGVSESDSDTDLGSGGAMLLPVQTDSGGTQRHLAIGAGKDSNIYIVDTTNMGKFNANNDSAIYQQINGALPGGVWAVPAFLGEHVYFGPEGGQMLSFQFRNALLGTTPTSKTATSFTYPGTSPSVSANGGTNGIVWAIEHVNPSVLHAYTATNLATELYNTNQASGSRDQFGQAAHFGTPTIVNGKVYVGTTNSVAAFGLLP